METTSNIVLLERVDGRHVFVGEIKVERVEIGLDARSSHRFWKHDVATSSTPVDQDLCGSLAEALCNLTNTRVAQLVATSKWRVSLDLDVVLLAQRDEFFALAERVDFDLVHARDHLGMLEKALEMLCAEVGHTDGLDYAQLLSGLEGTPRVETLLFTLGWRVKEVEVEVVQAELLQGVD